MTIQFDGDMAYVPIEPIKATFTDSANCTRLCVRSAFDNLIDAARFYLELRDEDGVSYYQDNIDISGADYAAWDGTNLIDYPFTFIASAKGLTILEDSE